MMSCGGILLGGAAANRGTGAKGVASGTWVFATPGGWLFRVHTRSARTQLAQGCVRERGLSSQLHVLDRCLSHWSQECRILSRVGSPGAGRGANCRPWYTQGTAPTRWNWHLRHPIPASRSMSQACVYEAVQWSHRAGVAPAKTGSSLIATFAGRVGTYRSINWHCRL